MDAGLTIVRADAAFVVVDKPAGLLSVPGKGEANQDCVAARVRAMFADARGPMIVHRLDMDTSGLMVVALTEGAQRALSGQFERRETAKAYVAVVEGRVATEEGEVRLPIRKDVEDRPRQIVDFVHGKESVTRYRVVGREGERTRLALWPVTGRTHQLRVHCAAGLGAAIVGDALYGTRGREARMMLHACELAFAHPVSGERVETRSAAPF